MSVFERCLEKCRARKGAVVYSDGEDRRVVSAAAKLIREGLVEPILIGDPEKVRAADVNGDGIVNEQDILHVLEFMKNETEGGAI